MSLKKNTNTKMKRGRKFKFTKEEELQILEQCKKESVTELTKRIGIDRTTFYLIKRRHSKEKPNNRYLKLKKFAHAKGFRNVTEAIRAYGKENLLSEI